MANPVVCLHCYVMVEGDQIPVIYSNLPLAHILCPAVPFNTAPALEYFLQNASSTVCFPIHRVLLRLAPGSTLPALQRECRLRSSAFLNQTDNLSLRCFSRKSKNYSFFLQNGAFIVTSWWEVIKSRSQTVIYSDLPLAHILCPAVPFNTASALECFLSNVSST